VKGEEITPRGSGLRGVALMDDGVEGSDGAICGGAGLVGLLLGDRFDRRTALSNPGGAGSVSSSKSRSRSISMSKSGKEPVSLSASSPAVGFMG